ncbi:right-handed parallel beta-helix repeat-containing protein [Alteromonas sp. H39]|uniref:right-handed parallel beta-helix repeat-containing protein n=1 Tax=Alteromonas sp. H39 TaxID=3389876 RepID=UPI0039DF772B
MRVIIVTLFFIATGVFAKGTVIVNSTQTLNQAIDRANTSAQPLTVLVEPGRYQLNRRLTFTRSGTTLAGITGIPGDVILYGSGMKKRAQNEILLDISADHITVTGVTLEQSANHLIQVRAEQDADNFTLSNCVLRDSYEQLLKVSAKNEPGQPYSDNGHIANCVFTYTAGIAPQFYVGGIDAHRARNWVVENNRFSNIASPANHVAEHAIHFWSGSENTTVTGNIIENSDRGIGFGLGDKPGQHSGGIIRGNVIVHTNTSHQFADTGIIVESSNGTVISENVVLLLSGYPNAIEYRFAGSSNLHISKNITLGDIAQRNGASAKLENNQLLTLKEGTSFFSKFL